MSLDSLGSAEFRNGMRQQASPYSIFAIKSSVADVVAELQNRFQVKEWKQNIDRQGKLGSWI